MDLHAIAGSGGTIELSGHLLTIRQLTIQDIADIQAWVAEKLPPPGEVAAKMLRELLPLKEADPVMFEECRRDIIQSAHADAKKGSGVDPAEAMSLLQGTDGLSYALFLSTRQHHPEVTYEHLKTWLGGENLGKVKEKLDRINALWVEVSSTNPPPSPTVPTPG